MQLKQRIGKQFVGAKAIQKRESLSISWSVLPLIILHRRNSSCRQQRQKQKIAPKELEVFPCQRTDLS